MAYYKTKQPTGLNVTRKAWVLTLNWKVADDDYKYGQQKSTRFTTSKYVWTYKTKKVKVKKGKKYVIKEVKEKNKKVKKKFVGKEVITSLSTERQSSPLKLNKTQYFPYTGKPYLDSITFWVRGMRATFEDEWYTYYPEWSNWSKVVYTVLIPSPPKVTSELTSAAENQSKFSWACPDKDTSTKLFTDYEWQTTLVENCTTSKGEEVSWKGVKSETGTSTSKTVTEGDVFSGYYSYTRWVRVRCRGPRGLSDWRYSNHIYAIPPTPKSASANADILSGKQGYLVSFKWTADATKAHPIDKTVVEYTSDTPATVARHVIDKDGVQWSHTDLDVYNFSSGTALSPLKDTDKEDGIVFQVTPMSPLDKCVIVRATTHHDNKTAPGIPTYATGSFGQLTKPVITNVGAPDPETRLFSISVTNGSAVDNTFVAVYCRLTSDPSNPKCIGVIPKGTTTITTRLPIIGDDDNYSIGAQTLLADYSPVTPSLTDVTDYQIDNQLMASEIVWDDRPVPKPPKNITLTNPKNGVIRVSWDWSWLQATGAELSWSEDPDAWESTTQPQTYEVSNTNVGSWNITGLDVGKWYVRVRLFRKEGDSTIYGTYSEKDKWIKISSAPAIPSLTLAPTVITKTEETTATWIYATSDGTPQSSARICEAYPEYEEIVSPSGSPIDNHYYEQGRELVSDIYYYSLSSDTEVIDGKTYYSPKNTWVYGDILAKTSTSDHLTIDASLQNWQSGEVHYLCIKVTSASGEMSEGWSNPEPITIADAPTVTVSSTSLVDRSVLVDEEEGIYDEYKALTKMPLTLTVLGAGATGQTIVNIERNSSYPIDRPDEMEFDGFDQETIALVTQPGDSAIEINNDDLIGYLDDGAQYVLDATVVDSYGQSVSLDDPIEFRVEWDHQAIMPEAEVSVLRDDLVTTILPLAPVGYYELSDDTEVDPEKTYYSRSGSGTDEDPYIYEPIISPEGNPHESLYYEDYDYSEDHIEIYRLSADPPNLIFNNAKMGTKYVDPYPTLGRFGGYRIVYITANGDYITSDNRLAWKDYKDSEDYLLDTFATIIDFGKDHIVLPYNITVSNKWQKDFQETKYLGGSIQGDWNPGVSRTASVGTTTVVEENPETIMAMRKLAVFAGICHVRTPEGSSYSANINVSEDREEKWVSKLAKFTLEITRVDPEEDEAIEYDKWIGTNE